MSNPIDVLEEVSSILAARAGTHGDWYEMHKDLAARWGLEKPSEVAVRMIELKLCRYYQSDGGHRDHLLDVIGYACIALACMERENDGE